MKSYGLRPNAATNEHPRGAGQWPVDEEGKQWAPQASGARLSLGQFRASAPRWPDHRIDDGEPPRRSGSHVIAIAIEWRTGGVEHVAFLSWTELGGGVQQAHRTVTAGGVSQKGVDRHQIPCVGLHGKGLHSLT